MNASSTVGPDTDMVDWEVAVSTARRLVKPGPAVTADEAAAAVADLKRYASAAEGPVRSFTEMDGSHGTAPVVVVDRLGWVQANTGAMQAIVAPLAEKIRQSRPAERGLFDQVGPKVTGIETGAVLAFLSSKVLGQFDPFWSGSTGPGGRLLLVAPNVVHVERELRLDPQDFRMWVCLHEETHRVQFTAVPWLRRHLQSEIEAFVDATEVDLSMMLSRLRAVGQSIVDSLRGQPGPSLLDVAQSDAQRAVLDRLTALMSLLEGHADVVMDGVGPGIVPSVATIRRRFQRRRESSAGLDRAVRRLIGMDAKMRQYRDGSRFVRSVVDQVGMSGFNRVWESSATLPSLSEITDPAGWMRRLGSAPAAQG